MALSTLNKLVLNVSQIPEGIFDDFESFLFDHETGAYVNYKIWCEDLFEFNTWLTTTYPELIGIEFLIYIDYPEYES